VHWRRIAPTRRQDRPEHRSARYLRRESKNSRSLSCARLLKRVFDLDLEHCPNCGGELKIIAAVLEQPVIQKILTHLGLQARAPPRALTRGPQLQAA
jgi:hypothetical protein